MLTGFRKFFFQISAERRCSGPRTQAIVEHRTGSPVCARTNCRQPYWVKACLEREPCMRKEPLLTAVPPTPVQSLNELYAIAFDQAQKAAQRYGALATQTDKRLLPLHPVFDFLATRERNRCHEPFSSLRQASRCLRSALDTDRYRSSGGYRRHSELQPGLRLTPRGHLRSVTASARSCSGRMLSRLPKILWYAGPQRIWRAKHCPTAICCVASGGLPGVPHKQSTTRVRRRLMRKSTNLARRPCWKVYSAET